MPFLVPTNCRNKVGLYPVIYSHEVDRLDIISVILLHAVFSSDPQDTGLILIKSVDGYLGKH